MRFGSVCSGIEAATVAWEPLGFQAAWLSEVEPFCCALLGHHYDTPNLGDITTLTEAALEKHGPIDVLVGGTPCQSFSVAGLRKGLADPRGNLALRFLQLAGATRPPWVLWENVPGVLSSGNGVDFATFLWGLEELGYGWAYRILDAQYFGVPQRRRRVFVVGYFGDWRRAAAVLFERESLCGHPPPGREAGAGTTHDIAGSIGASGRGFERAGETRRQDPVVATGITQRYCKGTDSDATDTPVTHSLRAKGFDASEDGTGRGTPLVPIAFDCKQSGEGGDQAPPLRALNHDKSHANAGGQLAVVYPIAPDADRANSEAVTPSPDAEGNVRLRDPGLGVGDDGDPSYTLASTKPPAVAVQEDGQNGVCERDTTGSLRANAPGHQPRGTLARVGMAVRRLTPRECERLQGFPDDYTKIPYRNKPAEACPDGPRYRALGNSMAVPVMRWIGERIAKGEA